MAEAVLQFLTAQNRPFSANDIVQNLGEKYGKTKVQNVLGGLVADEKVSEKIYGKQKIYCVVQSNDIPANEVRENILRVDREINELQGRLGEVDSALRIGDEELKEFQGVVSMEEAVATKRALEEEIEKFEEELSRISSKTLIKPEEKNAIVKNYNATLKEYNKRKRLCLEMVGAIFENYPKSKKTLLEEIGVETDEDVNFKVENK